MSLRPTISRTFCERWDERTPESAARKALESAIPSASRSIVPVNVEAAARFVGIEQILETEMSGADGSLHLAPSGSYIANLRIGQGEFRKRFTLAHEIGHAILYQSLTDKGSGLRPRDALRCGTPKAEDRDEERLCDILATELLMPRAQFLQKMEEVGVCASTIPQLSREFAVSLHASSRRVAQLSPYELGVGLWTKIDANSWLTPRWYVTKDGSRSIDYVIQTGEPGSSCFAEGPVRGWYWIPLQAHMEKYYVDVCPLGTVQRAWLLMVVFGSAAQQILSNMSNPRPGASMGQLPLWDE